MNRIVVVTGEYPPDIGGIGDYTCLLMHTPEAETWTLFYRKKWHSVFFVKYVKELLKLKPNVIFMQYPTRGYAWSFLPYLLCVYFSLFTKIVFIPVIHEYSEIHVIRKIKMNLILRTAKKIITTSIFEKQALITANKKLADKIKIVNIFSNTELFNSNKKIKDRHYDICYFGLISKNKGIEYFIDTVSAYKKNNPGLKTAIIGGFPDTKKYREYSAYVFQSAKEHDIELIINKSLPEITGLIDDTKILFLPYPDGCSERRGTYIAGLRAGCAVITRKGKYTTDAMLKTAYFFDENMPADACFDAILKTNSEAEYAERQKIIHEYLQGFPSPRDVAKEYNDFCS